VLLKAAGLQADATCANYTALSTLLGSNTEATFTNYARKVVTSGITVTTDTTNHKNTGGLGWLDLTAAGGASTMLWASCWFAGGPPPARRTPADPLFAHDLT